MNVILIPAYQPDERLLPLCRELVSLGFPAVVVIDDGSRTECAPLFEQAERIGCAVLHHPQNQGKGAAIKTGLRYARETLSADGFLTCDADGQHRPEDVAKVAKAMDEHPEALILGTRDFTRPEVPRQSRFGNRFSSMFFRYSTGQVCTDTQTGLRGIPASLFDLAVSIEGDRYDYEMDFLLKAAKGGTPILPVPIETVYLDKNKSSHFRPIVDSFRIYREPFTFALVSLASFAIDITLFSVFSDVLDGHVLYSVAAATLIARLISGVFNFFMNRIVSFRNFESLLRQFRRYFALYVLLLGLSIGLVSFFVWLLPIPRVAIKIVVDAALWVGSFLVQKHWVFARRKPQ